MGKANVATKVAGLQTMKITIENGFDWPKDVGAHQPGCPEWCPATHFGYLQSGQMTMKFNDGSEDVVVNAGDTYHIGPRLSKNGFYRPRSPAHYH